MQKPWKICAAASEHIFLATASERKCVAGIFYVEANVWLLLETFQCFFKERAAASEKILRKNDCFWNLLTEKTCLWKILILRKKCAAAS